MIIPIAFFKVTGVYLALILFLAGLMKLSFRNRNISFWATIKSLIIAAIIGILISCIIFKIYYKPGIYWISGPDNQHMIMCIVGLLPLVFIAAALVMTIKKKNVNK